MINKILMIAKTISMRCKYLYYLPQLLLNFGNPISNIWVFAQF